MKFDVEGIIDQIFDMRDYIADLMREIPRWIPVEERLPEFHDNGQEFESDTVLVNVRGVGIFTATYGKKYDDSGPWWWDPHGVDFDSDRVTHWMPLPRPPATKENTTGPLS
jgi:hypothetical protein